jgi:hypothetical protein
MFIAIVNARRERRQYDSLLHTTSNKLNHTGDAAAEPSGQRSASNA